MLRLLTLLSMQQTAEERFELPCLFQHVEESPFYNFVHNLQIGQYMLLGEYPKVCVNLQTDVR